MSGDGDQEVAATDDSESSPDWPTPTIVPLPPQLVVLLDEAALGDGDVAPVLAWLENFESELAGLRGYTLHPAEEKCLQQAADGLEAVRARLQEGDLVGACEGAFGLFKAMARFSQQRASNQQSPLPALNDLLMRGMSVLQGRASGTDVLESARAAAIDEVDGLVRTYQFLEESLPPEVQAAILQGIESVGEGFAKLQSTDDSQLSYALTSLKHGSELLSHLARWQMIRQAEQDGPVPLIGAFLRHVAAQGGPSYEEGELWAAELYPQFCEFWNQTYDRTLLPSAVRQPLYAAIDAEIESLAGLNSFSSEELAQSVARTEELFTAFVSDRLDLSPLAQHPERWKADLILAVMGDGVPRFLLENNSQELAERGETVLAEAIRAYLETGQRDGLVQALEAQLSAEPSATLDAWAG